MARRSRNARSGHTSTRRSALGWISVLLGMAASVVAGIPILGYLLAPALKRQSDQWIDLGPVDQFVEGETRLVDTLNPLRRPWDGDSGKMSAYVRRVDADSFLVMAINCTHLGCPVAWFPEAGLFMCPCHGGVYYEDGSRASGPPPRGLYQYDYRIVDGRLQIMGGHFPTLHDTFRDDESTTA